MTTTARLHRWNDIPREKLNDLLDRRLVTGERIMLAHVYLKKGCVVPKHLHENEQLTYILEGALQFWLGEDQKEEVVVRAGEVLLEKRPPTGIWGGMWCLPETARKTDLEADCLKRFGAHVVEVEALETIPHGFTHFTLDIQPLKLRVSALAPNAMEPGMMWLPLHEARGAAIPAPVREILGRL